MFRFRETESFYVHGIVLVTDAHGEALESLCSGRAEELNV